MKPNKWKSRKWSVVWISEIKYNPYKDVDINKKRPVMIWNNSLSLKGKVICFYCTTKYDRNNPFLYMINSIDDGNKNTWVDMRKIFFVSTKDIDWKTKWGNVKNKEVKEKINKFIKTYFNFNS